MFHASERNPAGSIFNPRSNPPRTSTSLLVQATITSHYWPFGFCLCPITWWPEGLFCNKNHVVLVLCSKPTGPALYLSGSQHRQCSPKALRLPLTLLWPHPLLTTGLQSHCRAHLHPFHMPAAGPLHCQDAVPRNPHDSLLPFPPVFAQT